MTQPLDSPSLWRSRAGTGLCITTVLLGSWAMLGTAPGSATQNPTPALDLYDLSGQAGIRHSLPLALREVSGLATTPDGRLFAHDDERAIVYEIHPESGRIIKSFSAGILGVGGDFEGIAIAGDRFFLLTSSGRLLEFQEGGPGSRVSYRIHTLGLQDQCEMEGLAYDEGRNALLIPCKNSRRTFLKDHLVVFSVSLETMKPNPAPLVTLSLKELDDAGLGNEFHPSAIEIHPGTGSLLILAAREEAIAELSADGRLLGTLKLRKSDHPQPEGIAFLLDGGMILADEGQQGSGTLTVYSRTRGVGSEER